MMKYVKNLYGSLGYVPEMHRVSSATTVESGCICELDPLNGSLCNDDTGACKFIVLANKAEDAEARIVPCIRLLPGTIVEGKYTESDYNSIWPGTRLGITAPVICYERFEKNESGRFELVSKYKDAKGTQLVTAMFMG